MGTIRIVGASFKIRRRGRGADTRLHHLSTWKAELKVLVAAAQQQSEVNSLTAPSKVERYSLSTAQLPKSALPVSSNGAGGDKVIFHVDFDCFFVSCGLATRPHLRGKPSVVCHSQTGKNASTSEIASASYEARAKGVKNGMSLGRARQLVGDTLQTIPYITSLFVHVGYSLMVDTNLIRTRNFRFHSIPS
jgi:DNA repair protein REV1